MKSHQLWFVVAVLQYAGDLLHPENRFKLGQ
jgi:hypothetical protein